MPRRARVVIPEMAHHVTQRGNYQQIVFDQQDDFRKYAYWMAEYACKYHVKILAYCLMRNHVHFIVVPANSSSLARLFNHVHMLYSQYKNAQKKTTGHLWQGRFYSCVLSEEHLYRAVRYVEQNPVRARIVDKPWEYSWSSAREHLNMERHPIIKTTDSVGFTRLDNIVNWKDYLQEDDSNMFDEIRKKTRKGLAVGSKEFMMGLERKFGFKLSEKKVGRPKNRALSLIL